jgi:predicted nuclease with RNAse H fold
VAKKTGVNKAAAIRDYLQKNPAAKGSEVVKALAAKGIKVGAAQVSNAKTTAKKKTGKKLGRKIAQDVSPEAKAIRIVEAATALLSETGSFEAAVNVLDRIRLVELSR